MRGIGHDAPPEFGPAPPGNPVAIYARMGVVGFVILAPKKKANPKVGLSL
jgi:hypothetical protein